MAVTETVKIVFEIDDKPIANTVQQLVALGKVSQEDAAKFNELSSASKVVSSSLGEASQGAEKFSVAGKDISTSIKDIGNSVKGVSVAAKPIRDAGTEAAGAANKFVSLRTRLKEAKDEVQKLVDQGFSPLSREVLAAQTRAGALSDELGDLNRQVNLLNPESKVQAFTNFGQGIVGAFQIATGALQAFGIENEQVQEIAQRLQGALNLAQGVQSIIQLKESFSDLSVVISSTAAASETIASGAKGFELIGEAASAAADNSDALTDSIEAGIGAAGNSATLLSTYKKVQDSNTAATKGATVAQAALNRTLLANPVFLLATSVGALIGAMYLLKSSTDDATQSEQEFERIKQDSRETTESLQEAEDQLAIARDKNAKFDIDRRKNKEALEKDLIKLFDNQLKAQEELNKAQEEFNKLGQGAGLSVKKEREERLNLAKQQKAQIDQDIENRKAEFNATSDLILLRQQELFIEDEKRKKSKEAAEALRIANETRQNSIKLINDEIAALQEAQRGELIGVQDEIQRIAIVDSYRSKIQEKQKEKAKLTGESIKLIDQKFANDSKQTFEDLFAAVEAQRDKDVADAEKAAADKLAAEQRLLQEKKAILSQEEAIALLRNQATATDETDLAEKNFNTQRDFLIKRIDLEKEGSLEQKRLLAELDLLYKNYENDKTKTAEEKSAERREIAAEAAQEAFDFILELNQQSFQRESEELEKQKEQGLITEEQYQQKLRALKNKQARADKEAAIFNATIQFSQALINALTTTPATAAPVALALAAAVAGLNLAKIIATPLPKFKHGTLAVPGRDTGEDTVHAMLRPGEAVIPTEINREYAPIIRAIYRKEVSSKEMNEFIESRDKSESSDTRKDLSIEDIKRFVSSYQSERNASIKELSMQDIKRFVSFYVNERQDTSKHLSTKDISEFINSRKNISYEEFSEVMRSKNSHLVTTKTIDVEPILKFDQVSLDALFKRDIKVSRINSTVNNTSASAMPSINVKADVDTYALSRAMAKNKSMEVTNVESIGEAVAEAMSKRTNRRQQI